MNPEEEFKEKGHQRTAFLCEVYGRTQGDPGKAVPYDQIETAIGFKKDATEQACLYLQAENFIEVYTSPIIHVTSPEGRTVEQSQSNREKLIVLTEKGISLARDICRS